MHAFTQLKFLSLLTLSLFGSSVKNKGFSINIFAPVDASLLQIRVVDTRDTGKSHQSDVEVHPRKNLRSTVNTYASKNTSSSKGAVGSSAYSQVSSRRRGKHNDGDVTINDDLLAAGEPEYVMDITTVYYSVYNFSFSGEDGHLPTTTAAFYDESGNGSEITVSIKNETDYFEWTDFGWADVALVTLFCSIIAGTVAGNMLVIAAVVTTRRLRTVTNCFVMSLAVADWLVGMFVMPPKVFLYFVDNEWRLGRIFCELWISLDILLCTASILSLCAISIDRYLAITRPLAYSRRRRSKRLALSMISCVWIAAVVITSPPIFGWYEEDRNTENRCDYNENTGYVVYSALGSFFLPLLVMLYVYARIACVITRRQRSIQKLHARSDRKSQYCGSDAEEPLHQKDRDDVGGKRESVEKQSHQTTTRITSATIDAGERGGSTGNGGSSPGDEQNLESECIGHHHQRLSERQSASSQSLSNGNQETNTSFLGRIGLSSCTSGNSESRSGSTIKNKRKHMEHISRQEKYKSKSQENEKNATSNTAALSLPDPATLASGNGAENSSSSGANEQDSGNGCSHSTSANQFHVQRLNRHHQHHISKMKTGSRLCHHSIATTSPQKNIHQVHQASSSSGRGFTDDEIQLTSVGSCRSLDRSPRPRVWTVETTSSSPASAIVKKKGKEVKLNSHNCGCSFEHELAEECNSGGDKCINQQESVMIMECSPAGNPASLMSAASASVNVTNISQVQHEKRTSYPTRIQSRIYQPHSTPNIHNNHHRMMHNNQMDNSSHTAVGMHRAKSMKLVSHIHSGNDQNHNGGSAGRDFSSGRIASFKRETKTAQTLAAVVGGFIICWLPFFVAYVMGPFVPSSDTIPSALMDALIWLGWSNSAINPFIYAFYSADFRSAFWRLTVHKCEVLINRNQDRNSPRRYEDPPQHQRVSS